MKGRKGKTYARAVQFPLCCKLDQRILFTALGTIHANATQAPKKLNSKSVTVATATPNDTTASVTACNVREKTVRNPISEYIHTNCVSGHPVEGKKSMHTAILLRIL